MFLTPKISQYKKATETPEDIPAKAIIKDTR